MTPKVSVCIPTFNGARYLTRTLDSVLAQDYDDFEIVVADHGSTDGTLDLVHAYVGEGVRVVAGPDERGAPANFNRAVSAARGRYVKLLCQDDLLYPECLSRQVDAMDDGERHGVVLVASRSDIVDSADRVIYPGRGWSRRAGVVDGGAALRALVRAGTNLVGEPSATLFRREAFDRAGGFSPTQSYMVDFELWTRLLASGNLVYLHDALCTFRVSPTSWSAELARSQAREARRTLREVYSRNRDVVTRADLAVGLTKPTALALARRAMFALAPRLPARRIERRAPVAASSEVA